MGRENVFRYYAHHASDYDAEHGRDQEHDIALRYIASLSRGLSCASVLDVGCGTGRGISFLTDFGFDVLGVDPVEEMLLVAARKGVPRERLISGSAEHLPFSDCSFDVVMELGVFHHVQDTQAALSEMLRVCRRAIFLSDENRFSYGGPLRRMATTLLCDMRLFRTAYWASTGGKGYRYSDGDGIAYSFSVWDAYPQLMDWGDRVFCRSFRPKAAQTVC